MILISTGHHPYSKGASFGKFNEFDEAKIWASLIANHLGSKAMLVPVGVLKEKVAFINSQLNAELAIEIHFNSLWIDENHNGAVDEGEHKGRGSETLYYPNSKLGKQAAILIQDALSRVFPPNRGAKEGWYRMNKINGPDYFLARTKCVSLILEPEFIHHEDLIKNKREIACMTIAETLMGI